MILSSYVEGRRIRPWPNAEKYVNASKSAEAQELRIFEGLNIFCIYLL